MKMKTNLKKVKYKTAQLDVQGLAKRVAASSSLV